MFEKNLHGGAEGEGGGETLLGVAGSVGIGGDVRRIIEGVEVEAASSVPMVVSKRWRGCLVMASWRDAPSK